MTAGAGTVEVAHEALIREWPTLREWLSEDREGAPRPPSPDRAAQEWQLLDRDAERAVPRRAAGQRGRVGDRPPEALSSARTSSVGLDRGAGDGGRRARDATPTRDRGGGAAGRVPGCGRPTAAPSRAAAQRSPGVAAVMAGAAVFLGVRAQQSAAEAEQQLRQGREPAPRRRVEHAAAAAGQRRAGRSAGLARAQRGLFAAGRHGAAARGAAATSVAAWLPTAAGGHISTSRPMAAHVITYRARWDRPAVERRRRRVSSARYAVGRHVQLVDLFSPDGTRFLDQLRGGHRRLGHGHR